MGGSSPQARGTQPVARPGFDCFWFIPAGAGNARDCHSQIPLATVHPRRRGERPQTPKIAMARFGSSPQARGTQLLRVCHAQIDRFIPAGAGNARAQNTPRQGKSVHPRRRGEREPRAVERCREPGSSPQARGTRSASTLSSILRRFIPAGAGNAGDVASNDFQRPVHPRRRGERPTVQPIRSLRLRFIPAGAGNAAEFLKLRCVVPVHPRRRGERSRALKG